MSLCSETEGLNWFLLGPWRQCKIAALKIGLTLSYYSCSHTGCVWWMCWLQLMLFVAEPGIIASWSGDIARTRNKDFQTNSSCQSSSSRWFRMSGDPCYVSWGYQRGMRQQLETQGAPGASTLRLSNQAECQLWSGAQGTGPGKSIS